MNPNSAMMTEFLLESLVGTTISSRRSDYKVEAVLGDGGSGVTFRCHKKLTKETVALKVIKKGLSYICFKEEVGILETLNDTGAEDYHIVTLKDAFMFKGHCCLEFKKLDIDLHDYTDNKSLSLKEIRPILFQMVENLIFLKYREIVHFDVKPENIMMVDHLRQPLKIELIDFGCALTSSKILKGSIRGTITYMAPEMLVGAPCDHSVDMWGLGCTAAELLTVSRLFDGKSIYSVLQRILTTSGMPPDHVLSAGDYTKQYFKKESRNEQSPIWRLKYPEEVWYEQWSPLQERSLDDILKVSPETAKKDGEALECDREAFVDLVTKMLHVDPAERITPEEAMEHPFLTLSHLDRSRYHNYFKSSTEAMKVCDKKKLREKGFPRCSDTSSSSTGNSSEDPGIRSDATRRRAKKGRSNNSTDVSLPLLFFAFLVLFTLANLSVLVPFLRGCGTHLLFTGKNISQLEFENSLIPLEVLLHPENAGLVAQLHPRKKKKKLVKLAGLPTLEKPTVLNQFLDTVWSLITKMDEIRLKTTDHCVTMITETWRNKNKRTARITMKLTSTIVVVFIAILWYQSNNTQTLFT